MCIKRYNDFINEEEGIIKNIIITLSTILGLGLSVSDAQEIKNDQSKLSIIKTLSDYNKNPNGIDYLKQDLNKVNLKNPENFIQEYIKIQPDRTITLNPHFKNADINFSANPQRKQFYLTYSIRL
jgi:hypothetical protein